MKVYSIQHVLTDGFIIAKEAEHQPAYPGYVRIEDDPEGYAQYLDPNEWAPDRDSALEKSEDMRRKQIERLKNLKIEVRE